MEFAKKYEYYYHEMADPRVTNWPLMGSPWPLILILASYVYFVFQCGPRYMKNKPAYELKTFIQFYDIFQVFANAYILKEILSVYPDATALRCDAGDYSWNPDAVRVARAVYCVHLLKIVDLIETGVFVLRKKKNQISFLHVYHHITTILFTLMVCRYIPGGMAVFYPALNSAVHAMMYSYYFLSSIEGMKKAVLPMKRWITLIQMVQFVLMLVQTYISLSPLCHVPRLPGIFMTPNILVNLFLFYNFYKKAYSNTKTTKLN